MDLKIADFGGGNDAVLPVSDKLFARKFNEALVHQVMTISMANARQGTRAQKTRSQVHHTRKKLFNQKGSGRARGGHSSSPLRRGGGRAFPSLQTENFQRKWTRRMFRAAMAIILSQLVREERLSVVRSLTLESKKTRDLLTKLTVASNGSGKILLVDTEWDDNILLAGRNLSNLMLADFTCLAPDDLARSDRVIFSERAIMRCAEVWA